MQVMCLQRGKVQTYKRVTSAEQHHGAVMITRDGTSDERIIPDARLVEVVAEEGTLIAELTREDVESESVLDAAVIRERDGTVRAWTDDVESTASDAASYPSRALDAVEEVSGSAL